MYENYYDQGYSTKLSGVADTVTTLAQGAYTAANTFTWYAAVITLLAFIVFRVYLAITGDPRERSFNKHTLQRIILLMLFISWVVKIAVIIYGIGAGL